MKLGTEDESGPELLRGAPLTRTAKRMLLAPRPMFFPASILPVILGTAWGARVAGELDAAVFALALAATVFVHAAVNVVNDVYDDISGTDPINTGRVHPFTGGSRFIQDGVMDRSAMSRLGLLLLAVASLFGIALAALKGAVVVAFGLFGAGLGVAYSATPLQLSARGLGELAVGIGFGVLPIMGAAWLQSGTFGLDSLLISLPPSFWVLNILLINEIPDIEADSAAGKRTFRCGGVCTVRGSYTSRPARWPCLQSQLLLPWVICRYSPLRCPASSSWSSSTPPRHWRVAHPRVRPSPRPSRRRSPSTRLAHCG